MTRIKISPNFVPKGRINNIPALVQIMAWHRRGAIISEPMMVSLLTHICVTQPQWINTFRPRQKGCHFADDIFRLVSSYEKCSLLIQISLRFVPNGPIDSMATLVQIMAWHQTGDKPWASYQIRKIAGCACAGNAGNVFPRRRFQRKPLVSDPGMHHGTCVTHVPWCMSGSLTCGDGENVPGIPGACAPAILRIWQEAHYQNQCWPSILMNICITRAQWFHVFVSEIYFRPSVFIKIWSEKSRAFHQDEHQEYIIFLGHVKLTTVMSVW